jgi:hypothetical protein
MEVGVGNPAEETYCYPNTIILIPMPLLSIGYAQLLHTFCAWFAQENQPNRRSAGAPECTSPCEVWEGRVFSFQGQVFSSRKPLKRLLIHAVARIPQLKLGVNEKR